MPQKTNDAGSGTTMTPRSIVPLPVVTAPRRGSRAVQLSTQYQVGGFPTVLVVDPHTGKKLGASVGLVDVHTMVSFLNRHAG